MQTHVGDFCAKPGFPQLKAVSFLKWLTGSQVPVTAKGMLVGIQPSIQEHVQLRRCLLYDLGYCDARSRCTKPRNRLVTNSSGEITAGCQRPRHTKEMAVLSGHKQTGFWPKSKMALIYDP